MKRADGIVLVDKHICRQPACVEACPEQAMIFGDLKDPDSAISRELRENGGEQIRADLGLNTGIRYQGL